MNWRAAMGIPELFGLWRAYQGRAGEAIPAFPMDWNPSRTRMVGECLSSGGVLGALKRAERGLGARRVVNAFWPLPRNDVGGVQRGRRRSAAADRQPVACARVGNRGLRERLR